MASKKKVAKKTAKKKVAKKTVKKSRTKKKALPIIVDVELEKPMPRKSKVTRYSDEQLDVFNRVEKALKRKFDLALYKTILPTADEIAQMGVQASVQWLVREVTLKEFTPLQREVALEAQRRLQKEGSWTIHLDGVPDDKKITALGKALAINKVYYASLYWGNVCNA